MQARAVSFGALPVVVPAMQAQPFPMVSSFGVQAIASSSPVKTRYMPSQSHDRQSAGATHESPLLFLTAFLPDQSGKMTRELAGCIKRYSSDRSLVRAEESLHLYFQELLLCSNTLL